MKRKRREQAAGTPNLGPATVAVLLRGWVEGDPPPDVPQGPHDLNGGYLGLYDVDGIPKLWRVHEAWLREQARLWGWEPTFMLGGLAMFYGEYVAAGGPEDWNPNVETH